MIPCLRVKEGVQFAVIAPGGFRILWALEQVADKIAHDLTITSGTDGAHSGPDDPHHRGEAYDVRISDLPDPQLALTSIQGLLDGRFFAWIEDAGAPNEHIHVQVRKGTVYPPAPITNAGEVNSAVNADN